MLFGTYILLNMQIEDELNNNFLAQIIYVLQYVRVP